MQKTGGRSPYWICRQELEESARVLGAYPDIDHKRLARCVEIVWKRNNPCIDTDEWDAEWEQLLAVSEDVPVEEVKKAMSRFLEEKRAEIEKAQFHSYVLTVECRVMEQHLIHGDKTTLAEVVRALGVDGYVAALEAELLKDGYKEHQIGDFLAGVRCHAVEMFGREGLLRNSGD